jgi:beta-lactam-binding protein with PASTA domain
LLIFHSPKASKELKMKILSVHVKCVLALLLLVIAVHFVLPSMPQAAQPIPNVMNMTAVQAKDVLKKAGYEAVTTEAAVTEGAKDGRVIYQVTAVPSGVSRVPVTIGVFGTDRTVNGIPNTVGKEEKQAVEVLQKAGFTVVVSYEKPASSSYIGRVTAFTSNIPAGTKRVGITVGTTPPAPPPVMVVIPNFVGKNYKSLGPLNGLTVDVDKYERVQNEADGFKVLAQNPPAGAKVLSNTKIMFTLGNYVPPPPQKPVPKLLDLTQADALKALKDAGFEQNSIIVKETAWQEWNGKVLGQDPAPNTMAELKYTIVRITVGKFTVTAFDTRVIPIPDDKNYLLMIKGGTPPYDVRASFDVPKNVYVAGTKYCEIVPLKDNPPGWISYRVSPRADMTARFTITDSKGVKHLYDVTMKKEAK